MSAEKSPAYTTRMPQGTRRRCLQPVPHVQGRPEPVRCVGHRQHVQVGAGGTRWRTRQIEIVDDGPAGGVAARHAPAERQQDDPEIIACGAAAGAIDFVTTIDWREPHKLLKVELPGGRSTPTRPSTRSSSATSRGPTHASRQFDADRFEVSAHKWTALSEQNRGCARAERLQVRRQRRGELHQPDPAKSALAPDMNADQGVQEFTYSLLRMERDVRRLQRSSARPTSSTCRFDGSGRRRAKRRCSP